MFPNTSFQTKKRKGFTLIETLIAVFIFSIAMISLIGAFAVFLKNYSNGKKIQKDIENAQYAMNIMAKTLRTSYLVTTTLAAGSPLDTYDYSQSLCIRYDYNSNKIRTANTTDSYPVTDPSRCTWATATSYHDLTANDIANVAISATKTASNLLGKITISLKVQDSSNTTSAVPIQMSVSLRQ